jgi:F-type H+-transporting ATPase subunit delta
MADDAIPRRFARAFLDLAVETKQVDPLLADLRRVLQAAQLDDGALIKTLSNPMFDRDERRGALAAVLAKVSVQPLVRNLVGVMLDKGRFGYFPQVVRFYESMADEAAGRERVVVETADALSPALMAEIREAMQRVTGKVVALETRVNPHLIGGMVARVGDKVYDASIRSRLEDIRQQLIQAQLPAEA